MCCTGRRKNKRSYTNAAITSAVVAGAVSLNEPLGHRPTSGWSAVPTHDDDYDIELSRRQHQPMGSGANEQMAPLMARASGGAAFRMSSQHERLILELLPFKDAGAFHAWLGGVYVRGSWLEFCRDYLQLAGFGGGSGSGGGPSEPDKTKTAQAAKDAVKAQNPKYLIFHPDKENWSPDDHHIRFIAAVIQDNMMKGLWSSSDFKSKGLDIAKAVYEVLMYLRSTYYSAGDSNPPGYSN